MSAADGAEVAPAVEPRKFQQRLRYADAMFGDGVANAEIVVFSAPDHRGENLDDALKLPCVTLHVQCDCLSAHLPRLSAFDARKLAALLTAAADVADGVQS